jgi:tripartite ATP-independent transporter DctM subunit
MSGTLAAAVGFVAMFALMLARVPVGVAMGIIGVAGFALLVGIEPGLRLLAQAPMRYASDEVLSVVPMFILMGTLATASGLGRELFFASNAFAGHRRGGQAVATIWASAGFAAICGSAVASAATMARVTLPEMKRYGYDRAFACATIAVGGTLGILIPPSVVMALYGAIVEQDVAKLFMAGVLPGIVAVVFHLAVIRYVVLRYPGKAPPGRLSSWRERWAAVRHVWAVLVLFLFVMGGMYGGAFTPSEGAAMGAGGALIIGVVRRRLNGSAIVEALVASARTTGSIFVIVFGAVVFGQFLAITQAPQTLSTWVGGLSLSRYEVLAIILVIYFILGAIMDEIAMILLTVPIVYPIILKLGFDPIWFGVIIVMTVELGLIVPPVALNLFVLHNIAGDVPLTSIFRAIVPFVVADVARLVVLCAFPIISTWLPSTMA